MDLIKVQLKTTVEETLLRAKFELLPKEMAEDSLTRWVTEFDQLSKQKSQEGRIYDREHLRDDDVLDFIVFPIVQNALTPKLSFYFASLFHIGRQWQVAQYATETATQALLADNLEKTAELNFQSFQDDFERLDIAPDERRAVLLDSLRELLSYSEEQHLKTIEKAKRLWEVWKNEVGELQNVVEEYIREFKGYKQHRERYGADYAIFMRGLYRLIFFSVEQHRLFHLLHQDGVQFKNVADHPQSPAALMQLLQLALMGGTERHFVEEIRNCFSMYHYEMEQQRLAPVVEQIETRLLESFRSENPFQKYEALKSPPDAELRRLWNECKLPNNNMFYYAKNWLDSLEQVPYFYYEEMRYKPSLTEEDIISYAKSADSTIKRKWVDTQSRSVWTDKDFIQHLFEKWIEVLARGALYPTIKEKGTQKWDVNSFHDLIDKVVNYLNTLGYSVTTPSLDRFRILWGELSKKDISYSSIDW